MGIEIDSISVLESKLTWVLSGDRNRFGFSVRTEIDLFFCAGIKIDFVFVCVSKITCF